MKTIKDMLVMEISRVLNKKILVILVFITLLSLYFVQTGVNSYKGIIESKVKFLDIEKLKVKQYINYAQYGTYGFRILFIPSPLSAYFINSSTISELTSNVDSGERLNIYNSFKGKTLFEEKAGGFKDFAGIMLLLGSLLVLYLGYEAFIYKDYLRFMTGFLPEGRLFAAIILARLGVLLFFFIFNAGLSLVLLKLNGIGLAGHDIRHLSIFMLVLGLMLVFFFVLGIIAGSFKSSFTGFIMVILSWFLFIFLIPGVVNGVTARKADNITSTYQMELEKLKILMGFEQRALDQRRSVPESREKSESDLKRELIENYWQREVKQIQASEKALERELEKNIRHYQGLSLFFPSTFYLSVGNEISSKGYENFIRFFDYIQALKTGFIRFYINKRYYENFSQVVSYIKSQENLFQARSDLPQGFGNGVVLNLVYITGLFCLAYRRFKRALET